MVIVVAAVLATLAVPVFSKFRARAQRAQCTNNLRNLHVAAQLYLQENGMWPQIDTNAAEESRENFADAWIAALTPFGPTRQTWICPAIQNSLGNPDYSSPASARVDYIATPFDDKPGTAQKWPRQPWFVERGDVHGHGQLIIFADGSVSDLRTIIAGAGGTR